MKICTFNIRCADDKNGHTIEERAPRLLKILNDCLPDVIGFQEATPKWMDILRENMSNEYHIFNKYRASDSLESAPIFFKKDRFNCLDKGYFWFSKTPWVESFGGDSFHCNRICEWVLLEDKKSAQKFYFLNLHFGFGDEYQAESVKLLKATTDAFKNDNVIIVGDFNAKRFENTYNQLVKHYIDVNQLTANYSGETFHNYGGSEVAHIDYCFIKKNGFIPVSYKILSQSFEGKYPSDHYGILIEFKD